ncbi:CBS domain-containing protein [Candidatus Uabimicrobium amorphum]|uniref:Membrane protein n=1 Tax=Uabimicrobium amorphum TaxID=2596890 RepID=A0A5S9IME5_UABAM|nr:CBS domain-containing protein [Candidatus Uabimicrobium amorphum]BBM84384.1 membrane protein [Candidatus Uabimicrobium amorphum]
MNISTIMNKNVQTIASDALVSQAMKDMNQKEIRHLVVMDGESVVGIISNRGIPINLANLTDEDDNFKMWSEIKVKDLMTPNPVIFNPGDEVVKLMQDAIDTKFGAFPIMDKGRLIGIVTVIDLLRVGLEALQSKN